MIANELRIGNYVINNALNPRDGWPVGYKSIEKATTETIKFSDFFEPIPLTEEWLVRFGLTTITPSDNGDSNYWSKDNDLSVDVEPNVTGHSVETLFYYCVHEKQRRKHLMYVHQLQNLYFALTGKELEIKNL